MTSSASRWLLAFDATCSTCQQMAAAVADACAGRVEIRPLGSHDVRRWREQALGQEAPWAPTLIEVDAGDRARAWIGPRMVAPLARRLGLRATLRTLRALGALRRTAAHRPAHGIGRARFLQAGAGIAVAAAVVLKGKTPALASAERADDARQWARANRENLPQSYEEVIALPMARRRAVYEASTPQVRSQLWVAQFNRFRRGYAGELSSAQREALDAITAFASRAERFDHERRHDPGRQAHRARLKQLREQAEQAFGTAQAYALFATLGPSASPSAPQPQACDVCPCSSEDDWCGGGRYCREINCAQGCNSPVFGCACFGLCGFLYDYECNGYCERIT